MGRAWLPDWNRTTTETTESAHPETASLPTPCQNAETNRGFASPDLACQTQRPTSSKQRGLGQTGGRPRRCRKAAVQSRAAASAASAARSARLGEAPRGEGAGLLGGTRDSASAERGAESLSPRGRSRSHGALCWNCFRCFRYFGVLRVGQDVFHFHRRQVRHARQPRCRQRAPHGR